MKTCKLCNKPAFTHGLCQSHWDATPGEIARRSAYQRSHPEQHREAASRWYFNNTTLSTHTLRRMMEGIVNGNR